MVCRLRDATPTNVGTMTGGQHHIDQLNPAQNLLKRCDIRAVSREYLVAERHSTLGGTVPIFVSTKMGLPLLPQTMQDVFQLTQKFLQAPLGDHQPDADLFAVGPMVERVAVLGQGIAIGLALEIRAGHVVKQQIALNAEQLAQSILQKRFQRLFVRQNRVPCAIETLLVDLLRRNAQEIHKRAQGVIVFGDVQFARWLAKAAEDQDQSRQRPGDFFAALAGCDTIPSMPGRHVVFRFFCDSTGE
jgi:hypothetical protein